jgi:hypothetical protein
MDWRSLGNPSPTRLRDARVQLHWAAQVLCGLADRWLPAQPDDSHTNMEWRPELGAMVGHPTASGLRLALRPRDLQLLAVRDDRTIATLSLGGTTLADAMRWADERAAEAEGTPVRGVQARDYDMPAHPVRSAGAAFTVDGDALAALGGWFEAGDALLREVAARETGSVPVRIWPHHFDDGSIVFLDEPGPAARQIGFGLSPGDHYYEEPYFYLTVSPMRPEPQFPPLAGGGLWREQPPFVGAVLRGSEIVAASDPLAAARAFFDSAFAAARTLLP